MSNFHPPPRPEPKSKEPMAWYEELLERDELLLYVTATLGVILPGIVYLIYQRLHTVYMKYAAKKEAERIVEEKAKCEIAVLRMGPENGAAAAFGTRVANLLKNEMAQPPLEWSASSVKSSLLTSFRGACIFVADSDGAEESSWLLDWMEDIAADSKAKKKAKFEDVRFAVVGFDGEKSEKVTKTVSRRMKILGAKQLLPVALFQDPVKEEVFTDWYEAFLDEMERHLPGVESSDDMTSESELEEEEENGKETHRKTL